MTMLCYIWLLYLIKFSILYTVARVPRSHERTFWLTKTRAPTEADVHNSSVAALCEVVIHAHFKKKKNHDINALHSHFSTLLLPLMRLLDFLTFLLDFLTLSAKTSETAAKLVF